MKCDWNCKEEQNSDDWKKKEKKSNHLNCTCKLSLFSYLWLGVNSSIYESVTMDPASISTALQSMDNVVGGGNMEDAMQNFIKNHVLSYPITCESTKTKWVLNYVHFFHRNFVSSFATLPERNRLVCVTPLDNRPKLNSQQIYSHQK